MDFRSSKLIVLLAIAFSVVISTMAYVGFRNAGGHLRRRSGLSDSADDGRPQYSQRYARASHRDATRAELKSLKKLRELVDAKDRLLQARTEQLRQATNQRDLLKRDLENLKRRHSQLRIETDQNIDAFAELSSQVQEVEHQTAAVAQEEPRLPADQPDGEADLDVEINLIQWQIEQANQRVADLEIAALRELVRSTEATLALVATGAAAVPALLDRLADDNPDVRRWAATVLGEIGPEASLAAEALLIALDDENEEVREAARIALERIENRS
jgi:chromosome segregation ATPase